METKSRPHSFLLSTSSLALITSQLVPNPNLFCSESIQATECSWETTQPWICIRRGTCRAAVPCRSLHSAFFPIFLRGYLKCLPLSSNLLPRKNSLPLRWGVPCVSEAKQGHQQELPKWPLIRQHVCLLRRAECSSRHTGGAQQTVNEWRSNFYQLVLFAPNQPFFCVPLVLSSGVTMGVALAMKRAPSECASLPAEASRARARFVILSSFCP